jgi:hypothetical protein
MTNRDNSYYPPRANALSPILGRFEACLRGLSGFSFRVPDTVTLLGLLGGFFVPGLALYLRSPGASGKAALGVCALLLLIFFAFLGFPAGNAAFTLLLSIHVVGFVAYCKPLLAGSPWPSRLIAAFLLSVATIVIVYLPSQYWLEHHLVVPLQVRGHVVVVRCLRSPGVIRRGDWIAFRVDSGREYFNGGNAHGNVIIEDGIGMAPVLAVSGDHIEFTPESVSVNGVAQPRQLNMPTSGEWTVPENCLFAWTDLAIHGHGGVPTALIAEAAIQTATVHREQIIGKAFKHWFGRRQWMS